MKTLLIGLGNPILTDDGAGVLAARVVREALPPGSGIDVIEAAVGGIALMEAMIGYQRVLLIDALWAPERAAGEVIVFDAGALPGTLNMASTHDADLPTALRVGRALAADLPTDEHIQIIAITAQDVLTFSEQPTPQVAAAIPRAAAAALALLGHPQA